MKKRGLFYIGILLLGILFVGCVGKEEKEPMKTDVPSATVLPEPTGVPTEAPTPTVTKAPTPTKAPTATPTPAPNDIEGYVLDVKLTEDYAAVSSMFEIADGWSNGSMFNCTWRKKNCVISDGSMKLMIDNDTAGATIPYSGAEFRSRDFFGYGYYEVTMKPIKNDGVVSSFFTYTGPSDKNPWDEIDIEFLGKDTTVVQFNYFTGGRGNHEFIYELGFDAAEEFHTYGFDWRSDSITWYVDGVAVHTATKDIPKTKGKIMMNVWPGKGVDSWLKPFDGTVPLTAEYKEIRFQK